MSLINPLARELSAKIVFYGPGLSGKTTSLKYLYSVIRAERRGELVTLATEGDRTLFFDFLPISIERVQDMPVRLQLYTVPGQIFYAATRKLVLNGADGVVFVADSQENALDSNKMSLEDLKENLREMGQDLATFPHVFQYNKRDLRGVLPVARLDAELNHQRAPAFETCASKGTGVLNALREVTRLVVRDLKRRQPQPKKMEEVHVVESDDTLAARLSEIAERNGEVAAAPSSWPAPPPRPDNARYDALSFASLWGDSPVAVEVVQNHIKEHEYGPAVRSAAGALAEMFESLPGTTSLDGPMSKAILLGLDGREYLRLCKLASTPDAALSQQEALFALYMLVAARVKLSAL